MPSNLSELQEIINKIEDNNKNNVVEQGLNDDGEYFISVGIVSTQRIGIFGIIDGKFVGFVSNDAIRERWEKEGIEQDKIDEECHQWVPARTSEDFLRVLFGEKELVDLVS
jgi:hypothetical protein